MTWVHTRVYFSHIQAVALCLCRKCDECTQVGHVSYSLLLVSPQLGQGKLPGGPRSTSFRGGDMRRGPQARQKQHIVMSCLSDSRNQSQGDPFPFCLSGVDLISPHHWQASASHSEQDTQPTLNFCHYLITWADFKTRKRTKYLKYLKTLETFIWRRLCIYAPYAVFSSAYGTLWGRRTPSRAIKQDNRFQRKGRDTSYGSITT